MKIKLVWGSLTIFILLTALASLFVSRSAADEDHQTPSALVQVTAAKKMPMSETLTAYGTISFAPEQLQQVLVPIESKVVKIFVVQGQTVKKELPLAQVLPSNNSGFNFRNAQIAAEFASKELNRLEQLRSQYLATNSEVEAAKQNLAKAQEDLKLNHIEKEGVILRAATDGTVMSVSAQIDQVVAVNSSIMLIATDNVLNVRLGIEEDDLSKIQLGQTVYIRSIQNINTQAVGKINKITHQINPDTGLIDVIVRVDHPPQFIAGSIVRAIVEIKPERSVLAVPRSAVLSQDNKPTIFVAKNGKAEQRFPVLGNEHENFISILTQLKPGESVVTLGNYELTNGMALRVAQP